MTLSDKELGKNNFSTAYLLLLRVIWDMFSALLNYALDIASVAVNPKNIRNLRNHRKKRFPLSIDGLGYLLNLGIIRYILERK